MLIFAAILAILVYGIIAAMLGTILPTLNFTETQSGYIALAQGLGLTIASVSVGPLIDNKGKKIGLLLGLSLVAVALFALPSAAGFAPVVASLLVLGLGGGIIVTGANALISDISESRRATIMNLLNLFFGLGGLITPLLASLFPQGKALLMCYLAAGLAVLTLAVHSRVPMPPPSGQRSFKSGEAGQILGRPALWLLAAFLFLYVAAEVGVWNWLAKHLVAQGVPEPQALRILSLGFALGLLIGRVAVSPILIKVPAHTVTLVAAVLMTGTTYAMLQARDQQTAWIAVFCAGLAMAPVFPTTLAMVGNAFPKMTATALGIVITSGWIGLVVSSPIIGGIAGKDPARLKIALLVLPVASAIMIVVNLVLRPVLARRA